MAPVGPAPGPPSGGPGISENPRQGFFCAVPARRRGIPTATNQRPPAKSSRVKPVPRLRDGRTALCTGSATQRGRNIQQPATVSKIDRRVPNQLRPEKRRLPRGDGGAIRQGKHPVPLGRAKIAPFDIQMNRRVMDQATQGAARKVGALRGPGKGCGMTVLIH